MDIPAAPPVVSVPNTEAQPDLTALAQTANAAPAAAPVAPVAPAPVAAPPAEDKIVLTSDQLKERLTRASSKQLRDAFGTDDVATIAAKIKAGEEATARAEEARRSKLDETTRMQEDLTKLKRERDIAKMQAAKLQQARLVDAEQRRLNNLASQHVDPRYATHAVRDFASHLRSNYTAEQIAKITPEQQKNWFAKYAKLRPEIARKQAGAAQPAAAPEVRNVPLNNGANAPTNPQAPSGLTRAKTAKPGNGDLTMSADDIQRTYGVSW